MRQQIYPYATNKTFLILSGLDSALDFALFELTLSQLGKIEYIEHFSTLDSEGITHNYCQLEYEEPQATKDLLSISPINFGGNEVTVAEIEEIISEDEEDDEETFEKIGNLASPDLTEGLRQNSESFMINWICQSHDLNSSTISSNKESFKEMLKGVAEKKVTQLDEDPYNLTFRVGN